MASKTLGKTKKRAHAHGELAGVEKALTGIAGFDAITGGWLPAGRPSLICGGAGCGKTIFAVEFLVHGAQRFDEPGVFVAFEESAEDLAKNVASLGYDLQELQDKKLLAVDHVHLDPSEIHEAGNYTLDGLFVRLELAVKSVKAKRVVIDTLEVLFGALKDEGILRAELQRLFRWLKERGLTAIITAERGGGTLTRHGLEEYVSDCVVLLDQRVDESSATRRMRVIKYRGSTHGANEYPFLIDEHGFSVLPMSSVQLDYEVSRERISTGVPDLDAMLGGEGYFRTSTILVSGAAGTGKSSLSARFVDAACARGEKCIMFALEESPAQVIRNMRSVGIDLEQWREKGLLTIMATRPTLYGLEMHLVSMHKLIESFKPRVVVVDPISSLDTAGTSREVKAMMVRLFDALKLSQITGFMTYLTTPGRKEETDIGISSLIDTWLEVRDLEMHGERTRGLYVIKSRGMSHSNQVREFVISDDGIHLLDVYPSADGILTGSARLTQDSKVAATEKALLLAAQRTEELLAQKKRALEAQVAALQASFALETDSIRQEISDRQERALREHEERRLFSESRSGGPTSVRSEKKPQAKSKKKGR